MELTNAPLINEVALKQKGQKGGSLGKLNSANREFKKYIESKGFKSFEDAKGSESYKALIEGFEMSSFVNGKLSPEQATKYLPLFNTANYIINIIEFTKQAFLEDITTKETAEEFVEVLFKDKEEEKDNILKEFDNIVKDTSKSPEQKLESTKDLLAKAFLKDKEEEKENILKEFGKVDKDTSKSPEQKLESKKELLAKALLKSFAYARNNPEFLDKLKFKYLGRCRCRSRCWG